MLFRYQRTLLAVYYTSGVTEQKRMPSQKKVLPPHTFCHIEDYFPSPTSSACKGERTYNAGTRVMGAKNKQARCACFLRRA
jgi:hypothetical protein